MRAVAFEGKRRIRVVDVEKPESGVDGVVVRVHACGICGTDMHVFNSGLFAETSTMGVDGYRIIGHEFTGEIVEVGEGVTGWAVGDRVASVHNKGGMAEYVRVPGDCLKNLFRIPSGLSYVTTATLEPFCNPVHSFHLCEPTVDQTVAIFGSGVIGLGYLQVVKAYTRARAIVVDISPLRLDTASKLGADVLINARETDPIKEIKSLTGEYPVRYHAKSAGGCDIAIDCAGTPLTINQALEVVKPADGAVVAAALYADTLPFDANMVVLKYMAIFGSMGYSKEETEEALQLIGTGRVNRDLLITHSIPLNEAARAFDVQGDATVAVKVIVVIE